MTKMSNKNLKFRKIHFAVAAVEGSAKKLNVPGNKMYLRLEKQNLIEERLFKHYKQLHTQSRDWVVEDTIETLKNWEKESRAIRRQAKGKQQASNHSQQHLKVIELKKTNNNFE